MRFQFNRWKWETAKMATYVLTPVAIFTYFSNPATYEKELVEMYKKYNVPVSDEHMQLLDEAKDRARQKKLEELRNRVQREMK